MFLFISLHACNSIFSLTNMSKEGDRLPYGAEEQ